MHSPRDKLSSSSPLPILPPQINPFLAPSYPNMLTDVLEETKESIKVPTVKPNTYKNTLRQVSHHFIFGHKMLVTSLHMQIRKISHLIKSFKFILLDINYRKINLFSFLLLKEVRTLLQTKADA